MQYPLQLIPIKENLSLFLPIPEEIRAAYGKTLRNDPQSPFPYWAKVWPSSLALMAYLEEQEDLVKEKTVLEIGAGTGLPSFSIARSAASIILSDHSEEAVELMEKNIAHLGLANVKAMCLDWNHFPEEIKAEVVLLSDINYAPEQFSPLFTLIHRFLAENAVVIIATPQRMLGAPFVEALLPKVITNQLFYKEDVSISILLLLNHKKE
jgi:predicted nicotinamide N-methyase